MGLLDDAIREHIELKRRAGASSEDVARMEREALAPARREAAPPVEEGEPVEEAVLEEELPPADPPEAPLAREPEPEPEPAAEEAPAPAPAAEEEPAPPPETAPPTAEWELEEAFPEEAAPEAEAEADADADEADEEDVLEETPDFLQETPEHDRLWFEQKPPRDFDFDR